MNRVMAWQRWIAELGGHRRLSLIVATMIIASGVGCSPAEEITDDVGANEDITPVDCQGLFGTPGDATGLDETQCDPQCDCGPVQWRAPDYDAAFVEGLREWTLVDPLEVPDSDPYGEEVAIGDRDGVCGVEIVDDAEKRYRLQTFGSSRELEEAGAIGTHDSACGLCSTLQDLAVYIANPDLTAPVRECGLRGITDGEASQRACIEALGFSPGCAQIWSWNTSNTREACMDICITLLDAPHNQPDGSLNDCLSCDERESGDVFKAVAGRTRRNSGIPSAICRPCEDLVRLNHDDSLDDDFP